MRKKSISFDKIHKKIGVYFYNAQSFLSDFYKSECERVTGEEPIDSIAGVKLRKDKDHFRPEVIELIQKLTDKKYTQKEIAEIVNQTFKVDIKFWNVNQIQNRYVKR